MKRLCVFALACLAVALTATPAFAAADLNVVLRQQVPIGAPAGTFTLSGDLSDSGTFRFTSFLTAGPPAFQLSTEHVTETLQGANGTLMDSKQCLSVFIGFGFSDECQALVTGGTGAYEGLRGTGTCSGLINFITRIASQTCELRLKT